MFIALILVTAILIFDQLSKFLVLQYIGFDSTVVLVKNILSITPVLNTGGGFGILRNQTYLLIIISILSILFIAVLIINGILQQKKGIKVCKRFFVQQTPLLRFTFAMVLAGAIGNLIDRVRLGAVIDFIDFRIWPIFNIADSFITIGFVILAFHLLKSRSKD